jgi:predicted nucleic acid-binding protein
MTPATFIDTGAFIALVDQGDQFHTKARRASLEAEKEGPRLTTYFVLMETCLYLQRRLSQAVAKKFWSFLLFGEAGVKLISPEMTDLERAYRIAEQYQDQDFSFVDCTSFAVIERLKIRRVFSFDHHFDVFRSVGGTLERFP